eukprot:10069832-Ditylum_brightwellii.AAC.1
MARPKHTPRLGTHEKVDASPKDDGPEEDGNAPKGSSFDDDTKKTNELGKNANSEDEFDNNCTGGDNSEESSVEDDDKSKEIPVKDNNKEDDMASS